VLGAREGGVPVLELLDLLAEDERRRLEHGREAGRDVGRHGAVVGSQIDEGDLPCCRRGHQIFCS
jgi:hypothetical protein